MSMATCQSEFLDACASNSVSNTSGPLPLAVGFVAACGTGALESAQRLWNEVRPQVTACVGKAFDAAVTGGHIHVVTWLYGEASRLLTPQLHTRCIDGVTGHSRSMYDTLLRLGFGPPTIKRRQEVFESSIKARDKVWLPILLEIDDWRPVLTDFKFQAPALEQLCDGPEDLSYLEWVWTTLGSPTVKTLGNPLFSYALTRRNLTTANWVQRHLDVGPCKPMFHRDGHMFNVHTVHHSIMDEYNAWREKCGGVSKASSTFQEPASTH